MARNVPISGDPLITQNALTSISEDQLFARVGRSRALFLVVGLGDPDLFLVT